MRQGMVISVLGKMGQKVGKVERRSRGVLDAPRNALRKLISSFLLWFVVSSLSPSTIWKRIPWSHRRQRLLCRGSHVRESRSPAQSGLWQTRVLPVCNLPQVPRLPRLPGRSCCGVGCNFNYAGDSWETCRGRHVLAPCPWPRPCQQCVWLTISSVALFVIFRHLEVNIAD